MEALVDNIRIKSAQADCLIDYGPPILDHIFSECLQLPVLLIKSQITVRLKLLPPGEQILNRSQGTWACPCFNYIEDMKIFTIPRTLSTLKTRTKVLLPYFRALGCLLIFSVDKVCLFLAIYFIGTCKHLLVLWLIQISIAPFKKFIWILLPCSPSRNFYTDVSTEQWADPRDLQKPGHIRSLGSFSWADLFYLHLQH